MPAKAWPVMPMLAGLRKRQGGAARRGKASVSVSLTTAAGKPPPPHPQFR
jgi:hypothetical protein